jgi:dTMP kinase
MNKHADFLKNMQDTIARDGIQYPTVGLKKGYLISFEGVDGAGKTTQVDLLAKALQQLGFHVHQFRSPGSSSLGESLREIVKNPSSKICDAAELLLMNADRAQLVEEKIRPALEAGGICICDRFLYSTIIYQGFGRQTDMNIINALLQFTVGPTVPDLTFVMDISPEESAKRKANRGGTDRFEGEALAYQTRIAQGFDWLKSKEKESNGKILNIDSSGSIEDVHNEIYRCTAFRVGKLKEGQLTVDAGNKIIT